jgi:hypothetical protein
LTTNGVAARDPLDAVPVVPTDVRSAPLPNGLLLERRVPAEGRVGAFVERSLGLRRTRRFELDELGAAYFRAIDGTRSLSDIARELAERRGLGVEEGSRAVRAFTEALVARGLVALRIHG